MRTTQPAKRLEITTFAWCFILVPFLCLQRTKCVPADASTVANAYAEVGERNKIKALLMLSLLSPSVHSSVKKGVCRPCPWWPKGRKQKN